MRPAKFTRPLSLYLQFGGVPVARRMGCQWVGNLSLMKSGNEFRVNKGLSAGARETLNITIHAREATMHDARLTISRSLKSSSGAPDFSVDLHSDAGEIQRVASRFGNRGKGFNYWFI